MTSDRSSSATSYRTGTDLVNEAKSRISEVTPDEVRAAQSSSADTVYLDVREANEWNLGHLPSAVHIPRGQLEGRAEGTLDRGRRIVVYCAGGSRSALAADTLTQMGYDATSLRGGFRGWVETGGDVED